jgi:hypothetical protein
MVATNHPPTLPSLNFMLNTRDLAGNNPVGGREVD